MRTLALIVLLVLSGCGGGTKIDLRNGTYERRPDLLMDKQFQSLRASVKDSEGESELEVIGYRSETAEVLGVFLEWLGGNFTIVPKEVGE
jgi:hypothetical protein